MYNCNTNFLLCYWELQGNENCSKNIFRQGCIRMACTKHVSMGFGWKTKPSIASDVLPSSKYINNTDAGRCYSSQMYHGKNIIPFFSLGIFYTLKDLKYNIYLPKSYVYSFRLTIETVELGLEQLTTTKCAIFMSCTGYMASNRFTPTSASLPDLLNGPGTKVLDCEIFLRRKHLQSTN